MIAPVSEPMTVPVPGTRSSLLLVTQRTRWWGEGVDGRYLSSTDRKAFNIG